MHDLAFFFKPTFHKEHPERDASIFSWLFYRAELEGVKEVFQRNGGKADPSLAETMGCGPLTLVQLYVLVPSPRRYNHGRINPILKHVRLPTSSSVPLFPPRFPPSLKLQKSFVFCSGYALSLAKPPDLTRDGDSEIE